MEEKEIALPIDQIEAIKDFDEKMTGTRMTTGDALKMALYITNHVITDDKILHLLLNKFDD